MLGSFSVGNGAARLAVQQAGAGPVVVLLHPGVADQRCWSHVARSLAATFSVVSYDRRGFGETTYEPEPHTSLADLIAVLDAVGGPPVWLVGNSNGGALALDLALAEPHRVCGLVLVSAAIDGAPPPADVPAAVQRLRHEIDESEAAGDLDTTNELEARLWLDGPFRTPGTVRGAMRDLFFEMNRRALHAGPTGEVPSERRRSAWDRLDELDMRILAVAGDHDLPHLADRMHDVAARVAGARYVSLPDSAHLPQLDDPGRFAGVLADFMQAP